MNLKKELNGFEWGKLPFVLFALFLIFVLPLGVIYFGIESIQSEKSENEAFCNEIGFENYVKGLGYRECYTVLENKTKISQEYSEIKGEFYIK